MTGRVRRRLPGVLLLACVCAGLAACRQDMHDQPRDEPLTASRFFEDGRSARDPVPHTVARGHLSLDALLETGRVAGADGTVFPFPVTRDVMSRGRERFDIYCSPCHGRTGRGDGMVVRRGFRRPPTFHSERLRGVAVGHLVDVMTTGFGAMPAYASQIPARDRWAIAAYIRALQLSEHATLDDVPAGEREALR